MTAAAGIYLPSRSLKRQTARYDSSREISPLPIIDETAGYDDSDCEQTMYPLLEETTEYDEVSSREISLVRYN